MKAAKIVLFASLAILLAMVIIYYISISPASEKTEVVSAREQYQKELEMKEKQK
ncbi:MAG: hypothetical protein MJ131_01805 [Lachnospiraceae bacterium]|nr:hypothetical protein [Lachnospiraceae bacterium]